MEMGINLATASDSWRVVRRAEELGFAYAWFYDTQMLNADVFVAMAAAAMRTSRIMLGTGVLIPSNRIAPVAANALASLNALAPGRIHCGISTGFTARRAMGLGPIKQAEMEEYIRVVQGLLRRETVTWEHEGQTRKIRFLNPELDLINTDDPIPLHISALGPRGRKLTARLGAGWMFTVRDVQRSSAALADMRTAWREAGRPETGLYSTGIASGCVMREGDTYDSPRVRAQAGPSASMVFHDLAEAAEHGSLGHAVPAVLGSALDRYLDVYRSYQPADARYLSNHRGHLMFLRPEEQTLLTGDMIRALSFTAPAAELVERVRELERAGYSQFSAHIRHGHPEMVEDWADLLAKV
jgi:5,10-methylenetetrahydromethanopterin reductase